MIPITVTDSAAVVGAIRVLGAGGTRSSVADTVVFVWPRFFLGLDERDFGAALFFSCLTYVVAFAMNAVTTESGLQHSIH